MCWMDSILMCQNSGHVLNKFCVFFLKHWFLNIFISWNCQVILLFRNSLPQNWLSVSRHFCSLETHFLPVEFNFGKALNRSLVTEIMLKLSFISNCLNSCKAICSRKKSTASRFSLLVFMLIIWYNKNLTRLCQVGYLLQKMMKEETVNFH